MKSILAAIAMVVMVLGSAGTAEASTPCSGHLNETVTVYKGDKALGTLRLYYNNDKECAVVKKSVNTDEATKTKIRYKVYTEVDYSTSNWKVSRSNTYTWSKPVNLNGPQDFAVVKAGIKYNGKWYWSA